MTRLCVFPLALLMMGCGGSLGSLLTTVPPPVEFIATRTGGVAELPVAGTYRGTLTVERVTYRYQNVPGEEQKEWKLVRSIPLEGSGDAEATVGSDGTIALRRLGESSALFSGKLEVRDQEVNGTLTVATLTANDGSTTLYPYILRNGDPRTLTIQPHGKLLSSEPTIATFDRYDFELSPGE